MFLREKLKQLDKRIAKRVKPLFKQPDYAILHNARYRGLYGGKTKKTIVRIRNLPKNACPLDYMGTAELLANYRVVAQTLQKYDKVSLSRRKAFDIVYKEGRKQRFKIYSKMATFPENFQKALYIKKALKALKHREENKKVRPITDYFTRIRSNRSTA